MPTSQEMTPHAAAALADEAEALAFADLYAAVPASLRARLGVRVELVAGATALLVPGVPSPMFNRVLGLGLRQPADVADVHALIDIYRTARSPHWWLHWNPYAAPAGMLSRFAEIGFTQPARRSWAKVLRDSAPAPRIVTDLSIAPAAHAQAARAVEVIVQAFEMPAFMGEWLLGLHGRPQWRLYAATDGADVVGGAFLFTSGEVGWLGMGSVQASHRRRGGQGALMARRIADAIEVGARYLVTETGEPVADEPNPSLANMKRCGFRTVASRLNFAGPA